MHISDIEGEYIPRKGDRVRYQVCPMPPRFDKPQAKFLYISRAVRYFYGTGFELVLGNFQFWQFSKPSVLAIFNFGTFQFWQLQF
jgi:hypothetical protein